MGATRPQPTRIRRTPGTRLAVLALLLCALPLSGCGKKRHLVDPIPPRYPVLSSPANVLVALAKAYASLDSAEYKSLFDDGYQGSSINQKDPSPQLVTFTKADEARHIAALAKSTTVTSIQLQLRNLVRSTDAGDPPGWALMQNPIFSLTIFDGPNSYDVAASTETIEFRFIPTLDSTSPTDTTWKIIRWTEVAQ